MNETKRYITLLKSMLKPERYEHSLGVMKTAVKLATHYGADVEKARMAGLLHDITKNMDKEKQMLMLEEYGYADDIVLMHAKGVWHSITGAYYIRDVLGIKDEEIFNAVRYHSSGRENMSILEKIIYTADFIEPARTYTNIERLRRLAYENLDKACYEGVKFCIEEKLSEDKTVYTDTFKFYNDLINKGAEK